MQNDITITSQAVAQSGLKAEGKPNTLFVTRINRNELYKRDKLFVNGNELKFKMV